MEMLQWLKPFSFFASSSSLSFLYNFKLRSFLCAGSPVVYFCPYCFSILFLNYLRESYRYLSPLSLNFQVFPPNKAIFIHKPQLSKSGNSTSITILVPNSWSMFKFHLSSQWCPLYLMYLFSPGSSGTMHCIFHCQSLVPSYLEQFLRLFVLLNLDIFESRGQLFGKIQNSSWHLRKGLRAEFLMTISGDVEAVSWRITLWETLAQTLGQVRLVQHTAPSMVCPWPPVFSAVALTRSGGDALSLSVTHTSTPFPPSLDLHTVCLESCPFLLSQPSFILLNDPDSWPHTFEQGAQPLRVCFFKPRPQKPSRWVTNEDLIV